MKKIHIAVTLGDPTGIGPEIADKASKDQRVQNKIHLTIIDIPTLNKFQPGKWTKESGEWSFNCVTKAVELCIAGKVDAIVTAPICKAAWHSAGHKWPGHTEYIAHLVGVETPVMMLMAKPEWASHPLRVAVAVGHESIANVPQKITMKRIIDMTFALYADLQKRFAIKSPKIAVTGLNPHAGEDGAFGCEEIDIIAPAIKHLNYNQVNAFGPLPADTVFAHALKGRWDAVLAMYHDQGLGPLKTIGFDCGVNVTLGLPIIRTSPDHGTAFDIAGRGEASHESMVQAILTAADMICAESK